MSKNIKPKFHLHLSYPEEFQETLDDFNNLILDDPRITSSMSAAHKSKGIFSHAIRFLIQSYVEGYKRRELMLENAKKSTQDNGSEKSAA